ncbi:GTP-binding protein [Actinokineospora sp. UTMC 2448]|uniref:CobW family GTP-binding protein n=1 Tax=Actinokineospora sp. UTMC 2448 TaxID=2268449 RepID=UPI002164A8C8|nr:GTP-binding protein [Actinokineospora sp. UTMC 2448]UVS77765.1 putative GTP-binding protein YjiA [Actinokineospora sp. UTMC 2448]
MLIPVVVVAGFLGSGKTSLLNHLLRTAGGRRIGVIVNDFGRINVDAMAVAAQVDSMVTLGNGCLCCAVDASDLADMLARLADADVDAIVIEASGLAEPPAMARMVLACPGVEFAGLVEVVDAAEFAATRERHPQIDKHLRYADLVVLNKIDRATDPGLAGLVRELAGGAPVVPTEHGRIDPDLLFDPVERPAAEQLSFFDLEDHSAHIHAGYDTVDFTCADPLDPVRLAAVLTDRHTGVYRAKGYVDFGLDERFAVQVVGGSVRVAREPGAGTELVFIGKDMDSDALHERLRATVAAGPADPVAMLSITRYERG